MGTVMSFSVDYQCSQGAPDPGGPYFWVVSPARGQPKKQPIRLAEEGTLQAFVQEWRPEVGPFQPHLEDQSGKKISNTLPLR